MRGRSVGLCEGEGSSFGAGEIISSLNNDNNNRHAAYGVYVFEHLTFVGGLGVNYWRI